MAKEIFFENNISANPNDIENFIKDRVETGDSTFEKLYNYGNEPTAFFGFNERIDGSNGFVQEDREFAGVTYKGGDEPSVIIGDKELGYIGDFVSTRLLYDSDAGIHYSAYGEKLPYESAMHTPYEYMDVRNYGTGEHFILLNEVTSTDSASNQVEITTYRGHDINDMQPSAVTVIDTENGTVVKQEITYDRGGFTEKIVCDPQYWSEDQPEYHYTSVGENETTGGTLSASYESGYKAEIEGSFLPVTYASITENIEDKKVSTAHFSEFDTLLDVRLAGKVDMPTQSVSITEFEGDKEVTYKYSRDGELEVKIVEYVENGVEIKEEYDADGNLRYTENDGKISFPEQEGFDNASIDNVGETEYIEISDEDNEIQISFEGNDYYYEGEIPQPNESIELHCNLPRGEATIEVSFDENKNYSIISKTERTYPSDTILKERTETTTFYDKDTGDVLGKEVVSKRSNYDESPKPGVYCAIDIVEKKETYDANDNLLSVDNTSIHYTHDYDSRDDWFEHHDKYTTHEEYNPDGSSHIENTHEFTDDYNGDMLIEKEIIDTDKDGNKITLIERTENGEKTTERIEEKKSENGDKEITKTIKIEKEGEATRYEKIEERYDSDGQKTYSKTETLNETTYRIDGAPENTRETVIENENGDKTVITETFITIDGENYVMDKTEVGYDGEGREIINIHTEYGVPDNDGDRFTTITTVSDGETTKEKLITNMEDAKITIEERDTEVQETDRENPDENIDNAPDSFETECDDKTQDTLASELGNEDNEPNEDIENYEEDDDDDDDDDYDSKFD